jgi:Fe-Mn family superoxide dismutase
VHPPDASREEIMNRRENLKCIAGAAALLSLGIGRAIAQTTPTGPFKLPPLGYAFDALEPHRCTDHDDPS